MTPEPRQHWKQPVWFSELCDAAVAGKPVSQALDDLGKLIAEATVDKSFGYGPPQDDINKARRRWLDMHDTMRIGTK